MASSSGTTTTTTTTSAMVTSSEGSASEELQLQVQVRMEQKKRRRMQSNRESARRSRVRKQQHVDGLTEQTGALRAENARVVAAVNAAARNYAAVEAENSVLRTQLLELSSRLSFLNGIVHYINDQQQQQQQQPLYMNQNNNNNNYYINNYDNSNSNSFFMSNNNSWNNNNLGYMNQHPIMASADHVLHYY